MLLFRPHTSLWWVASTLNLLNKTQGCRPSASQTQWCHSGLHGSVIKAGWYGGFPDSSVVKNPRANAGDTLLFLGQENPLEKEMATLSSLLTWRIPWIEEPSGLQSIGLQTVRHDWAHMRVVSRSQQKDFPQTLSEWSVVEAECHCYCLYFKWEFLLCWSNKESLGIQDLFLNSQAHVLKMKSYSFFPYKGTSVDMFITGPCYE